MRIIAIGDCHFPFHCKRTLKAVYKLVKQLEPTHIVQLGDFYDQLSWSKYPKSANIYTPMQELMAAQDIGFEFWGTLNAISKDSKKYLISGNHDSRAYKRIIEKVPESDFLFDIKKYFVFPNVKTIHDEREELIINNIVFMHGYRKAGEHVKHNMMNTVIGHLHHGYTQYYRHGKKLIWEMCVGFIGDINSPAFSYSKQRKFRSYHHGIGLIDENGPRFIPINVGD